MSESTDLELLLEAARNGFQALFKEHNENFYYCTLILSEGAAPFISAFSEEALKAAVRDNDNKYSLDELKWSYADSPYCGYGYEEYFKLLDKAFSERVNNIASDDEYNSALNYWLSLMEKAMKTLDSEKLFGEGDSRSNMLINAEIMPPDETNAERAARLNPKAVYKKWYRENFGEKYSVTDDFTERLSKMSRGEIALAIKDMDPAELKVLEKYLEKLNREDPV